MPPQGQALEQLRARFTHIPSLSVEAGRGGLTLLRITTPLAEAALYTHGAHVTHYQRRGGQPVLFMSERSLFKAATPIRGGVPVVFPWFGPHPTDSTMPLHGLVRQREWRLEAVEDQGGSEMAVRLAIESDDQTRAIWPHEFRMEFTVRVGRSLRMTLEVRHPAGSAPPMRFEEALHTYLSVSDVREVCVVGLEHAPFIDKTDRMIRKREGAGPLRVGAETDRVYNDAPNQCIVSDPAMKRRLMIKKSSAASAVVWNPWINKSRAMPDFGDDEWSRMLCVESGNVGEDAIMLASGGVHRMEVEIREVPIEG